jgi:hypothetical protein
VLKNGKISFRKLLIEFIVERKITTDVIHHWIINLIIIKIQIK